MDLQRTLTYILFCFFLLSCKKKNDNKNGNIEVIVNIVIKNDNDIILYYKDGSNEWFVDEKTVWVGVKGSENIQQTIFKINSNILPNDFRLDIGRNYFKGKETIQIKKFVLKYYDKSLVIPEDKFNLFFKGNEYVTYDEFTKTYILDKNKDGSYDPFFETTMEFYPELLKLTE